MPPEDVAEMVLAAIRLEDFLILTHDSYRKELVARAEALATRRLPELAEFA